MRRRPISPTPLLGVLVEHQCPRCAQPVELPLGALCEACTATLERAASRWARWVAVGTAALLGAYLWWRLPADPLPVQRLVGTLGVGLWFVVTYRVVKRIAREFL